LIFILISTHPCPLQGGDGSKIKTKISEKEIMMHTLHDFMIHTKAIAYLMAFGFLVVFTVFWRFLNKKTKNND